MTKKNGALKSAKSIEEKHHSLISTRLEKIFSEPIESQQYRLLTYLEKNPDSFTHRIAIQCAISYPPGLIWRMNQNVLPQFGLCILGSESPLPIVNRFGQATCVERWRIEVFAHCRR